jgi:hypothetical protein
MSSSLQVIANDVLCEANHALQGGGVYVGDAAQLLLHSCTVRLNKAARNGGGAFVDSDSVVQFDPKTKVMYDNVAAMYGGGVRAALHTHDMQVVTFNNTACHDDDVSVAVTSINVLGNTTIAEFVSRPDAGEGILPVNLNVSGHFGLPCEGIAVTGVLDGMYPLGTSSSGKHGIVNMLLNTQQPPGLYNITFIVADYPSIPPANLSRDIRSCIRGEVAPSPDTCQVCLPGSYSLDPSSQKACQPCPLTGATCPGGAAIVPLPGWWHSAADSAQMHR